MKTLLITGASSGIGAATARMAVKQGWRVALGARSVDKLEQMKTELGADKVIARKCDVTNFEDVEALVQQTVEQWGHLNAVLANAGLGSTKSGIEGGDLDNWRTMLDVNVLGLAHTAKAAIPALKSAGEGASFCVTASIAGKKVLSGSMYSTTKWAACGFAGNLRNELNKHGIRVTSICPGMVDTPFFDSPKPDALRPDDVARTVLFALDSPPHVEIHELVVLPIHKKDD